MSKIYCPNPDRALGPLRVANERARNFGVASAPAVAVGAAVSGALGSRQEDMLRRLMMAAAAPVAPRLGGLPKSRGRSLRARQRRVLDLFERPRPLPRPLDRPRGPTMTAG